MKAKPLPFGYAGKERAREDLLSPRVPLDDLAWRIVFKAPPERRRYLIAVGNVAPRAEVRRAA